MRPKDLQMLSMMGVDQSAFSAAGHVAVFVVGEQIREVDAVDGSHSMRGGG